MLDALSTPPAMSPPPPHLPADPTPVATPPTLTDVARLSGGHRWVEARLFTVTGGWSADGDIAAARRFFAAQSAFHAWRAEQWAARLPRSVPVADAPPMPGWIEATDRARELRGDVQRLAVWVGVLQPALLVGYRRHEAMLAPAADGGLGRWLGLALGDGVDGWLEGSDLLTGALRTADDLRRAGEAEVAARQRLFGQG